jgi:hypothetical protein
MENSLAHLDLASLQDLHRRESARLNELLINGALWDEVRELKLKVTDLAIAIHKKRKEDPLGSDMAQSN